MEFTGALTYSRPFDSLLLAWQTATDDFLRFNSYDSLDYPELTLKESRELFAYLKE